MASFKDKRGVDWCLDLDVHLVEQLQERAQIKIDDLLNEGFTGLRGLMGDVIKFGKTLWVICEEQATAKAVSPEQFAKGFNGTALEAAGEAFVQAIADFIPSRPRALLQAASAKGKELEEEATASALKKIREASFRPSSAATNSEPSSASTAVVEG